MDFEYRLAELNLLKLDLQVIGIGVFRAAMPECRWMIQAIDEALDELRQNFSQFMKENPAGDPEISHFSQLMQGVCDIFERIKRG
ncbi:MAG: hypothetical protein Q8Q50_08530 [Methylobacter sp.]|nr:hypothetical protein [Methylobacter sp.]